MTLFQTLISGSIVGLLLTALVHSWAGERYLIRPMFKRRGNPVLENALARVVLRFAWHLTSLMWLLLAAHIYAVAFAPQHINVVILWGTGGVFLAVGLFDLIASRGRHIGWPLLVLIGIFALGAAQFLP